MNHKLLPCLLAATLAAAALPAAAQSAGEWTLGVGVHNVDPKSNNGTLANGTLPLSIGSSARPSLTVEYFVRDNLGVEVLAAWPFEHDISVKGLGKVGSTKHLPPTVSLQYHFNDKGTVSPVIGAGVNFTTFFGSKTSGPLAGSDLSLASSGGLGLHARLDRLSAGHQRGLTRLRRSLADAPKRAIDVFGALFARPIDSKGDLLGMATGESLAHINHLVARGEVVAELGADGVRRYRAVPPPPAA